MKRYNSVLLIIASIFCLIQCTTKPSLKIEELSWLNGSWISPDSSNIETWAFEQGAFNGNVFSTAEGKITERLRVFTESEKIKYEATVLNQNDAKPIQFALNSTIKDSLHFTNEVHDFPNDIIYKKLSDTSIYVKVYGKSNPGFDFIMTRLKE